MPDLFSDATLKALAAQQAQTAPARKDDDEDDGIGVWPYAALIAGQVADGVTTAQALKRGGRELNPLLGQNIGQILATKAGIEAGVLFAMKKLEKNHPKIAKALGYASGTVGALAAGHNMRVMR